MTVHSGAAVLEKIETFQNWQKDYYEPSALRHYDKAVARMLRAMNPSKGSPVLDAGCGTGVHSIRIAKLGHQVRAIDISNTALDESRRRAEQAGVIDKIDFEQADVTSLHFDDASFETIFSWGVLIHIPAFEKCLEEAARVLKPGGRVGFQMTNMTAWDHKLESLARAIRRKGKLGQREKFGVGGYCETHKGPLYWFRTDFKAVEKKMNELGCKRVWYNLNLPAPPACTNIYVFQKNPR
jgi:SAM-dependent methyltransferase